MHDRSEKKRTYYTNQYHHINYFLSLAWTHTIISAGRGHQVMTSIRTRVQLQLAEFYMLYLSRSIHHHPSLSHFSIIRTSPSENHTDVPLITDVGLYVRFHPNKTSSNITPRKLLIHDLNKNARVVSIH